MAVPGCGPRTGAGAKLGTSLRLSRGILAVSMSLSDYRLVHSTALAVVPPEALWAPIQSARERMRDGGLFRWPPHINVFYPFVEPHVFARIAERFAPVLAQSDPFRVRLERFDVFGTASRGVVWLEPTVVGLAGPSGVKRQPASPPFAQLHERLVAVAPEIRQPSRPFVPHLTVTHTSSVIDAREIASALQAEWSAEGRAVEFEVSELAILCRSSPTHPFRLAWRLPLGCATFTPFAEPRAYESMPLPGSLDWRPRERRALHARMRAAHQRQLGAQ